MTERVLNLAIVLDIRFKRRLVRHIGFARKPLALLQKVFGASMAESPNTRITDIVRTICSPEAHTAPTTGTIVIVVATTTTIAATAFI
jgi:hypothetical protein